MAKISIGKPGVLRELSDNNNELIYKGKKLIGYNTSVITLDKDNWNDNLQTIEINSVTENNLVFVSPTNESYDEYGKAQIRATEQSEGELTFLCKKVPSDDITVNIAVID